MQLDPASGWCQGVRHCPSPNFNERPAGEVSLLVVHNISLPPAQFATGKVQEFFPESLGCHGTSLLCRDWPTYACQRIF